MVTGIFLFTFALSSLTVRFRPMQKLSFISANIFLSVICSVLLSLIDNTKLFSNFALANHAEYYS